MADKEISTGAQKARHSIYQFLLGFLVEVDHYVPAKDVVKEFRKGKGLHQIQSLE